MAEFKAVSHDGRISVFLIPERNSNAIECRIYDCAPRDLCECVVEPYQPKEGEVGPHAGNDWLCFFSESFFFSLIPVDSPQEHLKLVAEFVIDKVKQTTKVNRKQLCSRLANISILNGEIQEQSNVKDDSDQRQGSGQGNP